MQGRSLESRSGRSERPPEGMAGAALYPVRKVSGLGHKIIHLIFWRRFSSVLTPLPVPHSSCEVSFWPGLCEPVVSVGQHRKGPSEPEHHLEASVLLPRGLSNGKELQAASLPHSTPISRSKDSWSMEFMLQSFLPRSLHPFTLPVRITHSLWNPCDTENSFMPQKAPP